MVNRSTTRRKLRWAGRTNRRARSAARPVASTIAAAPAENVTAARLAIATACASAATGLMLCARRTRNGALAVAAKSARAFVEALAMDAAADPEPLRARTGDRLRWEWLASTATVVDGSADGRLLFECARVLSDACVVAAKVNGVDRELASRLRVAAAEAYSLASTSQLERNQDLLLALA